MNNFRYTLDKSSRQHHCPSCGKKRFVRYIDIETKQYLPEEYGKCNRSDNCRYHLNPYKDGYNTDEAKRNTGKASPPKIAQPLYYLPETVLNATLKVESFSNNFFVQNLLKICPLKDIEKVVSLYRIGTIGKGERAGATTFPFIDKAGNIRTIQAKLFNEENHTLKNGTDFVHSILVRHYVKKGESLPCWLNDYIKNEKYVTCLFGEHLLNKYPLNPVALVEAPKTALIATLYYGLPDNPDALLWLAVYNKSSLTIDRCKVLKNRKVVLFPDLNAYTEWLSRTRELSAILPDTRFVVSDLLEKNANENDKKQGLDLADYLTQFDYREFRQQPKRNIPERTQSRHPANSSETFTINTQQIQSKTSTAHNSPVFISPMSATELSRFDFLGADGLLHIHYPGIPETN
jgi:hypothetical protein